MKKNYFSENIAFLVAKSGLSQDDFGNLLGLKRGAINTYVKDKAFPKIDTLIKICEDYRLSLDDLIRTSLETGNPLKVREQRDEILQAQKTNVETYEVSPKYVAVLEQALEDKEKIIKALESQLHTEDKSKTA